jgi:hypothetical protein
MLSTYFPMKPSNLNYHLVWVWWGYALEWSMLWHCMLHTTLQWKDTIWYNVYYLGNYTIQYTISQSPIGRLCCCVYFILNPHDRVSNLGLKVSSAVWLGLGEVLQRETAHLWHLCELLNSISLNYRICNLST